MTKETGAVAAEQRVASLKSTPTLPEESRGTSAMERKIETRHEYPPIPIRCYDWRAWFEDMDEETRGGRRDARRRLGRDRGRSDCRPQGNLRPLVPSVPEARARREVLPHGRLPDWSRPMNAPLLDRLLGRAAAHRAKGATFDADLLQEAADRQEELLRALKQIAMAIEDQERFRDVAGVFKGCRAIAEEAIAAPTTTAPVDTAKGGEPKEERLTDVRLKQLHADTMDEWGKPSDWSPITGDEVRALLHEIQSHRAAAGREDFEIARIAVRDHWVDGCARCCKVEEPGRYEGDCSCGNISALVVRALKKGQS